MTKKPVKGTRRLTTSNTEVNALAFLVEQAIREQVNTAEVVSIKAAEQSGTDGAAGYASATPLVCQTDGYDNTLPPATIAKMPFLRPQAGKAAIVMDPQPGDKAILIAMKRDSSGVVTGRGEPVQPGSFRTFDQADGYLINGFLGETPEIWLHLNPVSGDISLSTKAADIEISCRESGDIAVKTKSGNLSLSTDAGNVTTKTGAGLTHEEATVTVTKKAPLIILDGNVRVTGNLTVDGLSEGAGGGVMRVAHGLDVSGGLLVTGGAAVSGGARIAGGVLASGDVVSGGVSLESHDHTGVTPGGGTSGPPEKNASVGESTAEESGLSLDLNADEATFRYNWHKSAILSKTGEDGRAAATPTDALLLCLPEIAAAEAERAYAPEDKQGWQHLDAMFRKWFSGPANTQPNNNLEPYWVDWDWVMQFERARRNYILFTSSPSQLKALGYDRYVDGPRNIYNDAAKKELGRILKLKGLLTTARTEFDFTGLPWPTWKPNHHTERPVGWLTDNTMFLVDGLQAALASFTLRALASGYVEPNEKGHTITVTGCSVFVRDGFNFEGEENYLGYGFWNCERKEFSPLGFKNLLTRDFTYLDNEEFTGFQKRHGIGNAFLVLSRPNRVENFQKFDYKYV